VELGERLRSAGWVTDLFVGGSLATGDYRAGISDLDLIAATSVLSDPTTRHPTWTPGALVERPLSGIARADRGRRRGSGTRLAACGPPCSTQRKARTVSAPTHCMVRVV